MSIFAGNLTEQQEKKLISMMKEAHIAQAHVPNITKRNTSSGACWMSAECKQWQMSYHYDDRYPRN